MFLTKSKDNGSTTLCRLLPNLVTLIGLCAGLTAIRFAMDGEWVKSVSLLLFAGFLDGVDGRLARFLNSSSPFGAELDSLIDFVNFGVVPGFLIYMWVNTYAHVYGFDWALVLFFAISMSLRLARFNVAMSEENPDPILTKYFFQGIPAPCAAAMAILPMVLYFEFGDGYFFTDPKFVLSYCFGLAVLVGSTIPTISIKKIPIRNEFIYVTLLILGLIAAGLAVKPWLTLAIIGVVYGFSIPVTAFFYLKIKYSKNS
ncbi:MAG: CDP-diacylglycerol--serine O-phosphatidyltransferase [Rickettsiales bacterium]|jgi:CDP-diacylglycerol--serine O-phosphatidyltransferase